MSALELLCFCEVGKVVHFFLFLLDLGVEIRITEDIRFESGMFSRNLSFPPHSRSLLTISAVTYIFARFDLSDRKKTPKTPHKCLAEVRGHPAKSHPSCFGMQPT